MGLKNVVNSHNGRVAMMIGFMSVLSFAIAGGFLWWAFYLSSANTGPISSEALAKGEGDFVSTALVEEEAPLQGLPSSTLEVHDSFNEAIPARAFSFSQDIVSDSAQESLVNTHLYRDNANSDAKGLLYDFKFYSSSLSDYDEAGPFSEATRQFRALSDFGASSVNFSSSPISSGGRELSIELVSSQGFATNTEKAFQTSWNNLITQLGGLVDFEEGTRVELTLSDASGSFILKTVLNSPETVASSVAIDERLWKTFGLYLNSSYYSFLDAKSVSYSIERTSQDSVMNITLGEDAIPADQLEKRMWQVVRDSDAGAVFPGSYITYLMAVDNPVPVVSFPSSSRNW